MADPRGIWQICILDPPLNLTIFWWYLAKKTKLPAHMHTNCARPCINPPPPRTVTFYCGWPWDPKRCHHNWTTDYSTAINSRTLHGNRTIMCSMDDNHVDVIRDIDSGCADNNISGSQGSSSLITTCADNNVSRTQGSFTLIVLYSPESSVSCSCSLVKRLSFCLKLWEFFPR